MFAIVSRFRFKTPLSDELRERIERQVVDPLSKMPGFQSYHAFFASPDRKEVVTFHTWDSQADGEHALRSLSGAVNTLVASELVEPPQRSMGEVRTHRGT